MSLIERVKFRLLMLWAAVRLGPSPFNIALALRVPRIAGGAPDEGDTGGEGSGSGDAGGAGGEDNGGDAGGDQDKGGDAGDLDLDAEELDRDRVKAALSKKNQENASLRKRLKEAEPLAAKARQAEEDAKSETTKLTEAKDEAVKEAAEAKAEVTRLRMAIKYGLDEDDLDLLGVGDEETIESRAKRLAEKIKQGQEPSNNGRTPRERLRPGAVPSSEPEESDPEKLAAKVPRMY